MSRILTCPIFYLNSKPHIGHLYTMVLADTQKRFLNLVKPEVTTKLSVGTDEHGTKIVQAAQAAKKSPKKLCNQNSKLFSKLADQYKITNDDFIRTTEARHFTKAQEMWQKIDSAGDFSFQTYKGWYCASDETFVAERDTVMKTLESGQEVRVMADAQHNQVTWTEEQNYVFDLDKYLDGALEKWIESNVYPRAGRKLALDHMHRLKHSTDGKLSVSRPMSRMDWAIPVPGDESQGIYVWLDALSNYLTTFPQYESQQHIVGKDIIKFHCIYWPAFLRSADIDFKRHSVYSHGHWTMEGYKMSKSLGNVVDPVNSELAKSMVFNPEAWRWYLMSQASTDLTNSTFSRQILAETLEHDLSSGIGTLMGRVTGKKFASGWPEYVNFDRSELSNLQAHLKQLPDTFKDHAINYRWNEALTSVIDTSFKMHGLLATHRPDKLEDTELRDSVLAISYEALRITSVLISPVVPEMSEKIAKKLNLQSNERTWDSLAEFYPKSLKSRPINFKSKPFFARVPTSSRVENAKLIGGAKVN